MGLKINRKIVCFSIEKNMYLFKFTDRPSIQTIPDKSVELGSTLRIRCKVTSANPVPIRYTWTKIYDRAFRQTGQVLTIWNIHLRHAGTYRCTAVNTMIPTNGSRQQGTDTEDVTVDVKCMNTRSWFLFTFFFIEKHKIIHNLRLFS